MKRALVLAAMALTAACKGRDITAPVATTGTLHVQIEEKTCSTQGAFDIEVFIDHVLVGTQKFSVGTTASFSVEGGAHTLGALAVDGRFSWGATTVTVPAGGEYTAFFACQ
jgi:hypothetical protein